MNVLQHGAGHARRIRPVATGLVILLVPLVLLLCVAGPAAAYVPGKLIWASSTGARGHDRWNVAIAKAPQGMVYTAGGVTIGGARGDDVLVQKYKPNGAIAWSKTWDGGGGPGTTDDGRAAVSDSKGTLYVAASASSPTGADLVMLKYSAAGRLLETDRLVAAPGEYLYPDAVALDPTGGVVVIGGSTIDFVSSGLAVSYDANVNQRWDRVFAPDAGDPDDGGKWLSDVVVGAGGDAYVAGYSYHGGTPQARVARLAAADGSVLAQAEYDATVASIGQAIALRGQRVVVAGWASDVSQQEAALAVRYDLTLVEQGRVEYQHPRGAASREFGNDVAIGAHGIFVAGSSNFPPPGGSGFYDSTLLLRWDGTSTSATWARLYKPRGQGAYVDHLALDGSDNAYLGGEVDTESSEENMLVLKYSASGARKWAKTWHDTGRDDDWTGGLLLGATPALYVAGGGSRGSDERAVLLRYNR